MSKIILKWIQNIKNPIKKFACFVLFSVVLIIFSSVYLFKNYRPLKILNNSFHYLLDIQGIQKKTIKGEKYSIPIYETKNNNSETLLLLHGFGSNASATWFKVFPPLKEKYHLIAPQMIYSNYQRVNQKGYNLNYEIDMLDDLLTAMKIKKVNLIGYSFGGWIGLKYVLQYPEKIKSLILIDAVALDIKIPEFVYIVPKNRMSAKKYLSYLFYDPPYVPGFLLDLYIENCRKGAQKYKSAVDKLFNSYVPLEGSLNKIVCPTLVIWAEHDKVLPASHAERISSQINNSSIRFVEKSGHAVTWENSKKLNQYIIDYLNSVHKSFF